MKYIPILHGNIKAWDQDRKPHKGGGDSRTVQEIPKELKPLAERYAAEAEKLYDTPWQPYTDQRYAGFTGDQFRGMDMIRSRAMQGSPITGQAESAIGSLLSGEINPYVGAMHQANINTSLRGYNDAINDFSTGTLPSIRSGAVASGNYGGSRHGIAEGLAGQQMERNARDLGIAAMDAGNNLYGNAFQNMQANQLSALGVAPQTANMGYTDALQLMNIGQMQQDQQQQGLDFGFEQFTDKQNKIYRDLAASAGVFGSNLGGSTTTSGGGK